MIYVLTVLCGCILGVLVEYFLHLAIHAFNNKMHADHHKEFFAHEPKQVATNAHPLKEYLLYAVIVFAVLSPLMFLMGWALYLAFYAGIFFHLMVVYQICHYLFHYDDALPDWLRRSRLFKWWRASHMEHHWHKPRRNYCVSFPLVDMIFGTYVWPRGNYRATPVVKKKSDGDKK